MATNLARPIEGDNFFIFCKETHDSRTGIGIDQTSKG